MKIFTAIIIIVAAVFIIAVCDGNAPIYLETEPFIASDINSAAGTNAGVESAATPFPANTYYYLNGKRYNADTGSVTYLCADPLCSHDTEDCKLYGLNNTNVFFVYENTAIYYYCDSNSLELIKNPFKKEIYFNSIRKYDIANDKTTVLFQADCEINSVRFVNDGKLLYFITGADIYKNDIKTGAASGMEYTVYEINLSGDQVAKIFNWSSYDNFTDLSYIHDKKLYWMEYNSKDKTDFYTTDFNGEQREDIDYYTFRKPSAKYGYIYYTTDKMDFSANQNPYATLYRYNYNTGIKESCAENAMQYVWDENYLYYYNNADGNIYRLSHGGEQPEIIYEGHETIKYIFLYNAVIGGDYLCCSALEKNPGKSDALSTPFSFFCLNTKTLEVKIIR